MTVYPPPWLTRAGRRIHVPLPLLRGYLPVRMTGFLAVFLLLYGSMQACVFWTVHRAFPHAIWVKVALVLFLVAMNLAPVFIFRLERAGMFGTAEIVAYVGYGWMAVSFWFCVLAGIVALWNLFVRGAALLSPRLGAPAIAPRPALAAIAILIVLALGWGVHEAWSIRLKRITVRTGRALPGAAPLRIVQISDMHLGLTVGKGKVRKVLALVEQARPDLLVSTGDLVDASFAHVEEEAAMLARAHAPLGKFAVTGNHEFYAGMSNSERFHEAAGFRLLRCEAETVGGCLRVAGVDDPGAHHVGEATACDEGGILPSGADREFTVLLKHRPEVAPGSPGRFDLQLSGHTHGGQIFPFGIVSAMANTYQPGLHRLAEGSVVYVSRGTGTWGPPLRLLSPPEVTVITVEPALDRGAGGHAP